MKTYTPQPVDTNDVKLNPSLGALIEKLAKHNHDIWAKQRIAEGWTYGSERDDKRKTTPCLVEYENLPESEKNYDRSTAVEALKCIVKLGYRILDPKQTQQAEAELALLTVTEKVNSKETTVKDLISLWKDHNREIWTCRPEIYLVLGRKFQKMGEPLLAFDVLKEGTDLAFPDIRDIRRIEDGKSKATYLALLQRQALSLAESGTPQQGIEILSKLKEQDCSDGETMGILGRCFKQAGFSAEDPRDRKKNLRDAFHIYQKGFKIAVQNGNAADSYYNGINAATLALILNDGEYQNLAKSVNEICEQEFVRHCAKGEAPPYWLHATLGEAQLLLRDLVKASEHYAKAGELAQKDFHALKSMRSQAHLILEHRNENPRILDKCFRIPSVVAFTGHMIDMPNRELSRFPENLENQIREEIATSLRKCDAGIGFSSAACGSDILFLEEMLKRNGEIHVFLPYQKEIFLKTSVDLIPDADWVNRFETVLANAAEVKILGEHHQFKDDDLCGFLNLYLYGAASSKAKFLGTELFPMAVWDGVDNNLKGGTSSIVKHWRDLGQSFEHINITGLRQKMHPDQDVSGQVAQDTKNQDIPGPIPQTAAIDFAVSHYPYLAMMFADVKGYSKLDDKQLLDFSTTFLNLMGDIVREYEDSLFSKRTQGDSLFLVFKDLNAGLKFASDLRDRLAGQKWEIYDLPADLAIRISLDAGPCYSYTDPVMERMEFCGAYVNRAARIEPITPPGHIYASESFVFLARASGIKSAEFQYAGQVMLPKNYGTIPVYHVR